MRGFFFAAPGIGAALPLQVLNAVLAIRYSDCPGSPGLNDPSLPQRRGASMGWAPAWITGRPFGGWSTFVDEPWIF